MMICIAKLSYLYFIDGRVCWIIRGAHLEVVHGLTGTRLAAWQFGQVLGDGNTSITCVKELPLGHSVHLLVGVSNASPTSLLCLFDVSLSKVTKAIEIPQPVSRKSIFYFSV